MRSITRQQLALYIVIGLFVVLVLFGFGMIVVILIGNQALATKLVNVFASMFAGLLGLATGFLLGRNGNGSNANH
jgi:divalent metal cation (Fe/Co/Zn/Cd) transporter